MADEVKPEIKLDAKLDINRVLEQIAAIFGEKTKKGLCNAGDLTYLHITKTLTEKCEKGEITVNDLLKKLDGMSYTKDLTKYLGRTKKIRFSFSHKKKKAQSPKCQ
jgi:hypothetical protein